MGPAASRHARPLGAAFDRAGEGLRLMDESMRYVVSADGTRIAVRLFGDRRLPPLLSVMSWATASPGTIAGSTMAALASERHVIAPDRRGTADSSRDVADLSLDAQVADLLAVVGGTADIVGWFDGAAIAIAFAARYAGRVRKMVLWHPFIDGSRYVPPERVQSLIALARSDWTLALHTLARIWSPRASADDLRVLVKGFRERLSPEVHVRSLLAVQSTNVEAEASRVQAETLILFPREAGYSPRHAHEAASVLRRATLKELDLATGFSKGPIGPAAILEFLRGHGASPVSESAETAHRTAIILFADIVDSTALTERLGDAAFRAKARELDAALRERVRSNGGTVIDAKTLGDGILAMFPAASQAIAAALSFESAAAVLGLGLHVGLHAGDVIREQDNVFGGAVNIAARISALAPPGQVLVSATVRDLGRTSAGVEFEDRGEHALKGVGEPQRVFAVRVAPGGAA